MTKLRSFVLVVTLLAVCCQTVLFAEAPATVEPRDAVVMVFMRSFMGRKAGNGFVIGDGTLVVTAHHVVFEESEKGRHEMAGLVSVASPYLGDGCEAEIVAADKELDLAVLRIRWKGHPALKLVDDSDLSDVERLAVIGIPEIIRCMGPGGREPFLEDIDVQTENLAVDYVAVRRQIPRLISLSETGNLGKGWSGSPMLLPGTNVAAGCFTSLQIARDGEVKSAKGPAVAQVRRLLKQSGAERSLEPTGSLLPRREDGIEAFLCYARAYRHYIAHRYGRASEGTREFIELRPESSLAHILAASSAVAQKDFDLADQHYRKAMALNPEAATARLFYAQFLTKRRPDEALEMIESLAEYDALKSYVALLTFNILSGRGQFQRCDELLTEAVKLNPRNAYLRLNLGACQGNLEKIDEAVANFAKAVELLPERGPFRGQFAHLLQEAGRLDEAEKHFRELLNIEPDNPVVHLWLAKFLAKHRPQAKDEALKEAQTALELPSRRGLPKEKIEQVIQELQSETTPAP